MILEGYCLPQQAAYHEQGEREEVYFQSNCILKGDPSGRPYGDTGHSPPEADAPT